MHDDLFDWLELPQPEIKPRVRSDFGQVSVPRSQPQKPVPFKASLQPKGKTDQGAKLRSLADGMTKAIDGKLHPAIAKQRATRRRANIAAGMAEEGRQMKLVQTWLYRLADAWDAGNVPPLLKHINSKLSLYQFTSMLRSLWAYPEAGYPRKDKDYSFEAVKDIWTSGNSSDQARCKTLVGIGITNAQMTWDAMIALKSLGSNAIDLKQVQLEQLQRDLIGCKIPGYFPTPTPIAQQMVDLADIRMGMRVLEPQAGSGSICDAIKAKYPEVDLDVVEVHPELRQILQAKGYNLIGRDFLDEVQDVKWDRVVANPPFENLADIDHTLHAFDRLLPDGRLVTIMSVAWTFRQDKKAEAFRDWVTDVGGDWDELPEGAFYASDRPTGVKTGILVVDK